MTYSKVMTCNSTAYYSGGDGGAAWTTAVGAKVSIGTIAVDPTVIPYYTKMFIQTSNGSRVYGMGTALDCGGAIKGQHRGPVVPLLRGLPQLGPPQRHRVYSGPQVLPEVHEKIPRGVPQGFFHVSMTAFSRRGQSPSSRWAAA